ncbi:MIF4G domain-containing protein [Caerostris darwini]|uniref:MIF4G domain-containing protein n=1 Tax=Caerostris darwini TaxID=1538125 RepID=A0AAV4NCS8_9ARAC|nr:MIF4G domain-containing protein [Caerostris darwini]
MLTIEPNLNNGMPQQQQIEKWAKWECHPTANIFNEMDLYRPSSPPIRLPSPVPFDDEYSIMTGRQDNAPVASVKAEHLHKDLHNFQGRDNLLRSQEIKSAKRSGPTSKSSRPPMEIYSPRKIISGKNGTKVHFVEGNVIKKSSPPPSNLLPAELKSALKRSKSFTADESRGIENIGFDRDAFPLEYQGLIRRAVLDPNSLSCQKLMELVRLICSKAVENVHYSGPAAQLCFSIIEKEHDHTFLESLQNCCREWYNERDKLLRAPFLTSVGTTAAGMRRWTAYVSFITELYLHVKNQHCQMIQPTQSGNSAGQLLGPHPNSPMAHLALTLQTLLYECANIILKPPSLNSEGEIGILRKMLSSVGKQLEADCAQRMQQMVINLRDAFINPSINAQIRKTLLELIELHASGWQLDLPQTLYYFPYTRL